MKETGDLYRRLTLRPGRKHARTVLRRITVSPAQLAYFLLQLPDPLGILTGGSRPGARIDLGLLHPGTQSLGAGHPAHRAILLIAPLDRSGSRRATTANLVARSRSSSGYFL